MVGLIRTGVPFSGFRWGIPEACNFEGKAIYTDVDMINMRDMAELVDLEVLKGKLCLARDGKRFGGKEFCVIVFDCAKWEKVVQGRNMERRCNCTPSIH